MAKKPIKRHAEHDSPFYKLHSRVKLARYLFCPPTKLRELTSGRDHYTSWSEPKKNGGIRVIEAPREDLKRVQRRIADLLQRIEPPKYLAAPVSGRSYVDNAASHRGSRSFRLLDIENFFSNCTAERVIWFFRKRMKCSPDVAVLLKILATRGGHLPQGSPCSPILAYFSYVDMWENVNSIIESDGCKLSIYIDDITISGPVIREETVWRVKQTLRKFGHRYQRQKERSAIDRPTEVTGVIVDANSGALLLPNRQHRKIFDLKRQLAKVRTVEARDALQRQLKGRKAQMGQILGRRP